jgi:hypothetical protein
VKAIFSIIFSVAIGGASIYFFNIHYVIVGLILFTWFLIRLFRYNFQKLSEDISRSETERLLNVSIELKVNVAGVLNHKATVSLFEKLKMNKKVAYEKRSEWIDSLIDNYKLEYKNENDTTYEGKRYVWDKIHYNITGNLLWKNEQIDFTNSIWHEIFVPYTYKEDLNEEARFWRTIDDGVRIRIVVINGMIKVQIGNFRKETSPEIYRESGLAAYKTWETITSFPLMYSSQSFPISCLGLSMYATESFKKHTLRIDSSKGFARDWKNLNAEIDDYRYLQKQFANDAPADKKFEKVISKFRTKHIEKLAAENFIDPFERLNRDDTWPQPDWMSDDNIHYENEYLGIFISDAKDNKYKRERYYLTDYYEEYP